MLQDKLNAKPPAPPPTRRRGPASNLICHESDLDAVGAARDALDSRAATRCLFFEGSEASAASITRAPAGTMRGRLLRRGERGWLRFKLLDCARRPAIAGRPSLRWAAVFWRAGDAPEAAAEKP